MSKHRRVKSLVRELEEVQQPTMASTSKTVPMSPPSIRTRTSSSSISTSTATISQPVTPEIATDAAEGGARKTLATPTDRNTGTPYSPARTLDYGQGAASSTSRGSNGMGGSAYEHDHQAMEMDIDIDDEDDVDAEEAEDIFLPLTSPFSANYSVNSNNQSPIRRESASPSKPSPFASQQLTAAEKREHSRRHSRVHSRNLSVFFPRPEQKGLPGFQSGQDQEGLPDIALSVDIPDAQTKGWGYSNAGQAQPYRESVEELAGQSPYPSSRRGHHHRHSMSHNFFPFLDSSSRRASGPSLSPQKAFNGISPASSGPSSAKSYLDTPKSVPALSNSTSRHRHTSSDPSLIPNLSLRSRYSHFPGPLRLILAVALHLPLLTQIALLASFCEVMLGASLWIAGQSGESLAVTGLGYLVVFDGIGALSSVIIEGNARGTERLWGIVQGRRAADNGVRYAFGTSRVTTLSHFTQCVYLIFSAVYVCKESIEHVLLLHGPDETGSDGTAGDAMHGASHGSMGHGQHMGAESSSGGNVFEWEETGVFIPTRLLTFSIAACLFTAIALQNHSSMTEAVGPQTYSLRPRLALNSGKSRLYRLAHNALLSNPFSLTVVVFSATLAAASLLIPAQQLAPLDKVVALLESIAMFYVAYPAAVCTGKVLLQTAPLHSEGISSTGDMANLRRALEDIENHSSVVYLPPAHIWQLTPTPPPALQAPSLKSSAFGRKSLPVLSQSTSKEPQITIVTLNVQVKKETTDEEILKMTIWCREKCMTALVGSAIGNTGKGSPKQAELTVQVVRFMEDRALQAEHGYDHRHHHAHGNADDHSQGNGHAHTHAHKEAHPVPAHEQHSHSHDHNSQAHHHH
ncbi:MAG: hypothetical protein CYPHOPRED_005652 [Cyphobasidiales sp. Tagirdzhanova-0007]|nr:MAG: hypothetical protein CYPHOPRED_005652 [Cyphobasidiales sp. Tagirdzhanova-0007]